MEREQRLNKVMASKPYRAFVTVVGYLRIATGREPLPHPNRSDYHDARRFINDLPQDHGTHWQDLLNPDHPISALRVDSPLSLIPDQGPASSADILQIILSCNQD